MVEEGNLFDPKRPSLGSGLEALHQHLEALSSGPTTWESHSHRPTGASTAGCVWGGAGQGMRPELQCQLGLKPGLVTSCHSLGHTSDTPSKPLF